MTGWIDLVEGGEPVLCYIKDAAGTIGASWRFRLEIADKAGTPLPFATLNVTGVCTVYSSRDGKGSAVTTLAVAVDDSGVVTLSKSEVETTALRAMAGGGWALRLTNPNVPVGQRVVQVFAAQNSPFPITMEG